MAREERVQSRRVRLIGLSRLARSVIAKSSIERTRQTGKRNENDQKKLTKERIFFLSSKENSRREKSTPNGLGQNGQRDSKLAMVDDGRTKGTGDWIEFWLSTRKCTTW